MSQEEAARQSWRRMERDFGPVVRLVRERGWDRALIAGTSHKGLVIRACERWDGPGTRLSIVPWGGEYTFEVFVREKGGVREVEAGVWKSIEGQADLERWLSVLVAEATPKDEVQKRTILIRMANTAALPGQTGNALFEEWCRNELDQGSTILVEDTGTREQFRLTLEGGLIKRALR